MNHRLLESLIDYKFKNRTLLDTALRHSSAKGNGMPSNEVLEFLGDSVINFLAASYVVKKFHFSAEGELTKMRSLLVCEDSLYSAANRIKLSEYMEIRSVKINKRMLANCLEAVIGAVYIDGGKIIAEKVWRRLFSVELSLVSPKSADVSDPKSRLQERLQKNKMPLPVYSCYPDGDGFRCEAVVGGKVVAVGRGASKKSAETESAKEALKEIPDPSFGWVPRPLCKRGKERGIFEKGGIKGGFLKKGEINPPDP